MLATAAALATLPAGAEATGLDPTFGDGGLTVTSIAYEPDLGYGGPVELGDGTLVAGTYEEYNVWRWSANGRELDPPRSSLDVNVDAMARRPTGGLVAAGTGLGNGIRVAALGDDLRPDPTFGSGGATTVRIPVGEFASASAIAVAPDGKVVVTGRVAVDRTWRLLVVRLLPDGRPDPRFGRNGVVVTTIPGTREPEKPYDREWTDAAAVLVDGAGRIVVAGTVVEARGDRVRAAGLRYLDDGTLDPAFGAGRGYATFAYAGVRVSTGAAVSMQPVVGRTRILVGGWVQAPYWSFGLAALDDAGALDRGFGSAGRVVTEFSGDTVVGALHVRPDGSVVAVGHPPWFSELASVTLARYRLDGALDRGFGVDGRACTDIRGNFDYGLVELGVLPAADGRLVVGGILNADRVALFVARYRAEFRSPLDCPSVNVARGKVVLSAFVRPGARPALDVARQATCGQYPSRLRRLGVFRLGRAARHGRATFRWTPRIRGRRLARRRCYDVTPLSLDAAGHVVDRFATTTIQL